MCSRCASLPPAAPPPSLPQPDGSDLFLPFQPPALPQLCADVGCPCPHLVGRSRRARSFMVFWNSLSLRCFIRSGFAWFSFIPWSSGEACTHPIVFGCGAGETDLPHVTEEDGDRELGLIPCSVLGRGTCKESCGHAAGEVLGVTETSSGAETLVITVRSCCPLAQWLGHVWAQ